MIEKKDIFHQNSKVSAAQREERNGHRGCVVWLTGLSAAGKSTIATELEARLFDIGLRAYVLDGDNLRHGLCSDLGFSEVDRTENIRRIGQVAALFADAGFVCIVAAISPYRAGRQAARELAPSGRFMEVHVHAPLEVLEKRDYKGLYARARASSLGRFTGISAPYETPLAPELDVATDQMSVDQSVGQILELIRPVTRATIPLSVALRPEEIGDEPFLFSVFASTRQEELDAVGWPPEVRNTFLTMQFRAMRQGYRASFPRAEFSVVLLNGQPAGLMVVDRGEEIRLVDVALLPACRSQGAGAFLIRRLLVEAEKSKKTVVLQVLAGNRAARLYQRLGFQFTEQSGMHHAMRWTSGA